MVFFTFQHFLFLFSITKTLLKEMVYNDFLAGSESALKEQLYPNPHSKSSWILIRFQICIEKNSWIQVRNTWMWIHTPQPWKEVIRIWACSFVLIRCSPHQITFHIESKTFAVVTSISEPSNKASQRGISALYKGIVSWNFWGLQLLNV